MVNCSVWIHILRNITTARNMPSQYLLKNQQDNVFSFGPGLTECPFRGEIGVIKHITFTKIRPKTDRYQQYQRRWVRMKQSKRETGQKVPKFYTRGFNYQRIFPISYRVFFCLRPGFLLSSADFLQKNATF